MTKKSDHLIRLTNDLIEATDDLRDVLLEYKKACQRMVKAEELGRRGSSTVEQMELLKFAEKRERVVGAIQDFEATRHRVRIALIEVAEEEGSNLSEVARTIGVSRQLMSRLSKESKARS